MEKLLSTDLPSSLENLKEEGAESIYEPPYEAAQGFKPENPKVVGEEHDYTETDVPRETGLPDVKELEHPVNLDAPAESGDETTGYSELGKDIEMGHGTVGAEEFRNK
jgi:hypothetical protein